MFSLSDRNGEWCASGNRFRVAVVYGIGLDMSPVTQKTTLTSHSDEIKLVRATDEHFDANLQKILDSDSTEYICPYLPGQLHSTVVHLLVSRKLRWFSGVTLGTLHQCLQMSYRDRLNELRIYFLKWRWERYGVIYTWKCLEGLAPDFGIERCTSLQTKVTALIQITQTSHLE